VSLPKPFVVAIAFAGIVGLVTSPSSHGRTDVADALGVVIVLKIGDGTVTSAGSSAIACGSRCRAVLPQGSLLTLAARAQRSFDYWGGACDGSATTCKLTVEKRTVVRARFAAGDTTPGGHDIRVAIGGRGIVRSDTPGLIECGSVPSRSACATVLTRGLLTLRATPASDSTFIRWTGSSSCRTSPTCQVDVGTSQSISATFQRRSVPDGTSTVRVQINDPRAGSVRFGAFVCPSTCAKPFAN
jgi:hypothetical protein